jgi:hypothetical protein
MGKPLPFLAPAIALTTFVVVLLTAAPPAPKNDSIPLSEFSAARAKHQLDELLRQGQPHPVGSPANAVVRDAIVHELNSLGYVADVESAFVCGRNNTCAQVSNVVAHVPGMKKGPRVILMSHYDSVPAGSGAADDLSGVVIALEAARAFAKEQRRNEILFLFTDGEEAGLLGAEAFVRESRFAEKPGVVVNLEARGTSGASFMFETSDDNGWLVSLVARSLRRPSTSSLFYTVYKSLPNDTDFTIFKGASWHGVNFAFIGSPAQYHTPLDSPAGLSLASLQHQGDNALSALRALAGADLEHTPKGNAVWFSLFDRWVVSWPEPWTVPLALLNLLVLAVAASVLMRRKELSAGNLFFGALWVLSSVILAAAVGFAGGKFLALRWGARAWIAHPLPAILFFWLSSLAVTTILAAALSRKCSASRLLPGAAACFAALSIAAAILAPGASFLVLVPGLALSLALVPARGLTLGEPWTASAIALITGAVLLPLAWMLYEAMGLPLMPVVSAVVALAAIALVPFMSLEGQGRFRVPGALSAGAISMLLVAVFLPPQSEQAPSPQNILHVEHAGSAEWLVAESALAVSPELVGSASWGTALVSPFPWSAASRFRSTSAPKAEGESPRVEMVSDEKTEDGRKLSLRITSRRGSARLRVAIEGRESIRSVAVDGRVLSLRKGDKAASWLVFRHLTLPPEGTVVEILVRQDARVRGVAVDETTGLPEGGSVIQKARGVNATPIGDGDRTVKMTEFSF